MTYNYLLFDLDGTLFDYDKAERIALKNTFELCGFEYNDNFLQKYRKINKQIWRDYEDGFISQKELKTERFRRLGGSIGLNIDPARFARQYLINLSQGRYLIAGVSDLLHEFSGAFRMYLITNGLKDVQRSRLAGSEITKYFRDVFISEEIGTAKPFRGIFDEAFRRMGSPNREEVIIIGDSLSSDIAGGEKSGIDTCWYNPSGFPNDSVHIPTYEIDDLSALKEILT